MPNGEEHGFGRARHSTEVMCETKDWPIVGDGAEAGVLGVGKFTVVDKLSANCHIRPRLVCRADGL